MTEQVLISIKGLQFVENDDEEMESIELVTVGSYHCRNNKKYIKYEEQFEGIEGTAKNLVKIKEDVLEVCKKGAIDVHMIFEKEKKNISYYTTPYGVMQLGIATTALNVEEKKDGLDIKVDYVLEMNDEYVADCVLQMSVASISKMS